MASLPAPHGDKLSALLQNDNLPPEDKPRVALAIVKYQRWLKDLKKIGGTEEEIVNGMTKLLNEYKLYIDFNLIFKSPNNFLHRQKGQLKLDNSIIEEFLPILVTVALADSLKSLDLSFGPSATFSSLRFEEAVTKELPGANMKIRSKDQDFAISRRLFIRASHNPDFQDPITSETNIAYFASEIKTNLDKTMFQEAAATALDVKSIVPGAKYFLVCEWLDMTPISTATTAIDEVLILRKAKRISSNVRGGFASSEGRQSNRQLYRNYLTSHPISTEPLLRLINHIRNIVDIGGENDVLARGYF